MFAPIDVVNRPTVNLDRRYVGCADVEDCVVVVVVDSRRIMIGLNMCWFYYHMRGRWLCLSSMIARFKRLSDSIIIECIEVTRSKITPFVCRRCCGANYNWIVPYSCWWSTDNVRRMAMATSWHRCESCVSCWALRSCQLSASFCCFWGKKRLCMLSFTKNSWVLVSSLILLIQSCVDWAYCTQLLCLSNSPDSWILVMPSG